MDEDDKPVGRMLTRREALALLGTTMLAACAPRITPTPTPPATSIVSPTQGLLPTVTTAATRPATADATVTQAPPTATTAPRAMCVARPELTEGPYFVDEMLNRSDIRSDPATGDVSAGVPLTLTFNVSEIGDGCTPLEGAQVDVWHCDAAGVYSDVQDRGFTSTGQKFLRGYQLTDANGQATFTTIYPGWYSGRAVHIHFKVRLNGATGQAYEFTSQLFFDEAVNDAVHALAPYAARGQRNVLNVNDRIFDEQLVVDATQTADGYSAAFDLGLNTA